MLIPRASRGSDPGRICHTPAGIRADRRDHVVWIPIQNTSEFVHAPIRPKYTALPRTKSGGDGFRPQRPARIGWRPHGDSNPGRNRERVVS